MSSTPSASNSNKTFSVTPSDNLSSETSYKTRITTGVKDLAGNALGSTYTTSNGFTSADVTAPILSQVTAVSTPTNDNTSSYTFSSTEAGTITYGGSCSSATTSATTGNNTVTFSELADGTYSDCTITVTDSATNTSSTLNVNTFIVDTTSQTLYGTSGDDTFNGGAGSDTLHGQAGNDIFNVTSKSGSFTDTIYGGAGTDSLVVNYTGISSLDNFTVNYSSSTSTFTFTDPSGGVINAKDIETFSFGGKSYVHYTGDGGTDINRNEKGFWSESENLLMLYGGASSFLRDFDQANKTLYGHSKNEDLTIKGNSETNYMNLGTIGSATDSDDYSGTLTLKMGGGSEGLAMYQPSGSSSDSTNHSIDLGAGDDYYYTASGAQSLAVSKLDGGAGIDKLYFDGTNTVALTLTTGNAINFENITGGGGDDNISGDNNANVLEGKNGTDNISGYGGNDILGGHDSSVSSESGNDLLYGGAGNDILYGTAGENKLDGGTGQDNMTGGNGADTFIIRSGDGGSALTDADIIMDYQDGTDVIGLDGGLSFDDLTIAQGSGSNSSHTTIRITSSGEYLSILQNVSASNISEADFSIMN